MADSLIISEIKTTSRICDPKTDRSAISGIATVKLEYGETALSFDVPFHDKANHTDAAIAVLRHVGNLAHFMENQAGEQERQSPNRLGLPRERCQ